MQRSETAKSSHLHGRKITHADGANLPLPIQRKQNFSSAFDRDDRIRPVNLIKIDVLRIQAAQRILKFLPQTFGRGVSKDPVGIPFQSRLRRDKELFASAVLPHCLADNLFGTPAAVNRSRVDQVDPAIEYG